MMVASKKFANLALVGLILLQGAILPGHAAVHAVQSLRTAENALKTEYFGGSTVLRSGSTSGVVVEGACELCQTLQTLSAATTLQDLAFALVPVVASLRPAPFQEVSSNIQGFALARGPPIHSFS